MGMAYGLENPKPYIIIPGISTIITGWQKYHDMLLILCEPLINKSKKEGELIGNTRV